VLLAGRPEEETGLADVIVEAFHATIPERREVQFS
jgi:hypothetical protein